MPRQKPAPKSAAEVTATKAGSEAGSEASFRKPLDYERDWFDYVSTLPDGVSLGPSRIAGAGIGAFACKPIPKGELLGEYVGRIVADTVSGPYVLHFGEGLTVDAADTTIAEWTRFINGARSTDGTANNVEFVKGVKGAKRFTVFIRSIRDIEGGEELLLDYGPEYDFYEGP